MNKKAGSPRCGNCGEIIFGSRSVPVGKMGSLSKTEKRTSRYFASNFCFSCLREIHKENARRFI